MIDIPNKINELNSQIDSLIDYMKSKINAKDYHAVMDAAADIRELEAEKVAYNDVLSRIK